MGLVDHQQRLVPLGQGDEAGQIAMVAIHAVDAFHHDQHAPVLAAHLPEQLLGRLEVVVGEGAAPGSGEHRALQEAVVGQCVVQHEVSRADHVPDHGFVGGMAAHERDAVFGADEAGDRLFQFAVDHLLPRNQPAGRHA